MLKRNIINILLFVFPLLFFSGCFKYVHPNFHSYGVRNLLLSFPDSNKNEDLKLMETEIIRMLQGKGYNVVTDLEKNTINNYLPIQAVLFVINAGAGEGAGFTSILFDPVSGQQLFKSLNSEARRCQEYGMRGKMLYAYPGATVYEYHKWRECTESRTDAIVRTINGAFLNFPPSLSQNTSTITVEQYIKGLVSLLGKKSWYWNNVTSNDIARLLDKDKIREPAVNALIAVIQDEKTDEETLLGAVIILGLIGDTKAIEPLKAALKANVNKRDPNPLFKPLKVYEGNPYMGPYKLSKFYPHLLRQIEIAIEAIEKRGADLKIIK